MRRRVKNLRNVCPCCRTYDPTWFVHALGCPADRWSAEVLRVGLVAARYRRDGVRILTSRGERIAVEVVP